MVVVRSVAVPARWLDGAQCLDLHILVPVAHKQLTQQILAVADWSRRYADRIDTRRIPDSKTKQNELALDYAKDGFTLLNCIYSPASPAWLRTLPAVQTQRRVLLQNYTRTTARNGQVRIKRRERAEDGGDGLPPAPIRIASPYDTDTRWSAKRDMFWNGYKLHISETCHPQADPPGRTSSPT